MGVVARHSKGIIVNEMRDAVQKQYGLDDAVVDRAIDDLQVKVRYCDGDTIETDCSCDSAYILEAMHRVGKAIRATYYWSC